MVLLRYTICEGGPYLEYIGRISGDSEIPVKTWGRYYYRNIPVILTECRENSHLFLVILPGSYNSVYIYIRGRGLGYQELSKGLVVSRA
jgi:hypothetical protein